MIMRKKTGCILLLFALAALLLAGRQHPRLLELRQAHQINQAQPLENMPPLVSFTTVALGGFRGIIADLLWIRAAEMQRQGRYFEIVQLASWITRLEPRFPEVWAYHGWNMAYNISFLFSNSEDRWRWVKNGFELLRDDGLRYNPGSTQLLTELGWIFQHKIAGTSDSAHLYYKKAWALEMHRLLGGPAPDYDHLSSTTSETLRKQYKLDPARMQAIDQQYGPLDWRSPQAQAIYWAALARESATPWNILSAERMIYQSLLDASRNGRIHLHPESGLFLTGPDLNLIPQVRKAYLQALQSRPDLPILQNAYLFFLQEAVTRLWVDGRMDEAKTLFAELKERSPDPVRPEELEPFARSGFIEEALSGHPDGLAGELTDLLRRSHIETSLGNPDLGEQLRRRAAEIRAAALPRVPDLPGLSTLESAATLNPEPQTPNPEP